VQALSARIFGPTRLHTDEAAPDVQLQSCQIGHLTLATTRYAQDMEVEPQPGKDHYVIQTVTAGRCRVAYGDVVAEMEPGSTWVFSPALPVRLLIDAGCERFSVVVRRPALEEAFRMCFNFDAPAPLMFALQPLADAPRAGRWRAMMQWLRAEAAMRAGGPALPAADAAIEQLCLTALLVDHFGADGGLLPRGYLPTLPAYVRCAIRYLRANLDKRCRCRRWPPTVVCANARCSSASARARTPRRWSTCACCGCRARVRHCKGPRPGRAWCRRLRCGTASRT